MQAQRMLDLKDQIAKQNLLILAAQNALFITKTVRSDAADPKSIIMAKLAITEDDVKYILGFTFQQISKLSEDAILKRVANLQAEYKVAKGHYNLPAEKCQADITEALAFFEKAK
jgi:DNA gyrase/topoisomerase IV subunit A